MLEAERPRLLICRAGDHPNPFERAAQALGMHVDVFEALHLRPYPPDKTSLQGLETLGHSDLVLFVSANAVRYGLGYFEGRQTLPAAAIGQSTANALKAAGWGEVITPLKSEDSEGLLARLDALGLAPRRALIVKGLGGRDTLERGLRARAGQVFLLTCYERLPASDLPSELKPVRAWAGVCAMSNAVIEATLNAVGPERRQALCSTPWIVIHPRQADFARQKGITQIVLTPGTSPDALRIGLETLLQG